MLRLTVFRLYALREHVDLPPDLDKGQVLERIKPHVIAVAELTGTFAGN